MKIINVWKWVGGTNRTRTYNYEELQAVRYRNKKKQLRFIVPSQIGYNGEDGTMLHDLSNKEFNQSYSLEPRY